MVNKKNGMTVTVEGPAASGKSTIGRMLAERLSYGFIDSGLLYRIVAKYMLEKDIAIETQEIVESKLQDINICLVPRKKTEMNELDILINREQINVESLNTPEIDKTVPLIARYEGVRKYIRSLQRLVASHGGIVIAGRDIGTVVLPDADLKIYLHVSERVRAQRRFNDVVKKGIPISFEEILTDLQNRDKMDENRKVSPMKKAQDAIVIEADNLDPNNIVEFILEHISQKK